MARTSRKSRRLLRRMICPKAAPRPWHESDELKIGLRVDAGFGDPAVVPLWFGEGDLPTPSFIADAAIAALRDGQTFYTHKRGIPALRRTIAEYLTRLHEKPVGAERVVVTSAGMSAIMLACQ